MHPRLHQRGRARFFNQAGTLDACPRRQVVNPLPQTSAPSFVVTWQGQDDSGVESYLLWVRVDGGEWQPWMESPDTSAEYPGESGRQYEFDIWARDLAGNWSTRVELEPQATTRVE